MIGYWIGLDWASVYILYGAIECNNGIKTHNYESIANSEWRMAKRRRYIL